MIFRILRSLSQLSNSQVTIQSHLDVLKSTKASQESVPGIIKTYYHLYTDIKESNYSINWNSDPIISNSITSIIPFLPKTEDKFVNSLIVSLGFMGISNHPIWKHIEPIFIKSSHTSVENIYIPFMISSFALCKSQNTSLWKILNKKMLEDYCTTQPMNIKTSTLTYKCLINMNQGTPPLLKLLKENIIKDIQQIKPALISELLGALSFAKIFDREFLSIISKQLIAMLDVIEVNELSSILFDLTLLAVDRKVVAKVEKKILEKIKDLSLKGVMNCFSVYSAKDEVGEFPRRLFSHYVNNREKLKWAVKNRQKLAAYDIKMLATGIGMKIEVPDEFFLKVYKEIQSSGITFENTKGLMASNAVIEKYKVFHKFRV